MNKQKLILPAEWQPQQAIILTWPHNQACWGPAFSKIQQSYYFLTKTITEYQHVIISVESEALQNKIQSKLIELRVNLNQISFYICPSDDIWVRDHGPLTVLKNGQAHLLNFQFDGWGNKYPAKLDNTICDNLHAQTAFNSLEMTTIDIVLEGGSVDVNGQGTLLTTSNCLLKRNSEMSRVDYEKLFKHYFAVNHVLWLDHGKLCHDDTDSHIDNLARFINGDTIIYLDCQDSKYRYYNDLQAMQAQLSNLKQFNGKKFQLIPIPQPDPIYNNSGHMLPASYINFLFINHAVLVPSYQVASDAIALDLFRQLFPKRDIISIDCSTLIQQYGSIHCASMQIAKSL